MSQRKKREHALEVLSAIREAQTPELPAELLSQCYAIQEEFQFERDGQVPIDRTRRLVESQVASELGRTADKRSDAR